MTHSLHRRGTKENLTNDFVVLATPAVGINQEGSKEKLIDLLDKIFELEPTNIGSYETGTIYSGATIEEIKNRLSETPRVRCCFNDKNKVRELVRYAKDMGFGLSITISGLIDDVKAIAAEEGITPHSINLSLKTHGNMELLPGQAVLEFVTMCGHGMVSRYLVDYVIRRIESGKMDIEKGAKILAKPCICGIFNTARAEMLLKKFVSH